MKVFKFGGASVMDAGGVKNVARVLESQGLGPCLLVISAMGKTTNALEKVVHLYFTKEDFQSDIEVIKKNHWAIAEGLFAEDSAVFGEISNLFEELQDFLHKNKSPNYSFVYDQVVSYGELISSKIVSEYLNSYGFPNQWLDARDYIKTDGTYREGTVNWETTEAHIRGMQKGKNYVTQGFIGSDDNNFTTTLGREGSDYSAAIFAYGLDADALTIWKDVPGVMTGDPRKFQDVKLLSNISYEEAIEMAYYGASVIHPKTLQPLQQKNIPFYVKSFLEPHHDGTKVSVTTKNQKIPTFILKEHQHLIRIATRDFSFIAEEHISQIFNLLAKYKIKVSLMQNSAISLALCLEDKYSNLEELNSELCTEFTTELLNDVSLFTIRNSDHNDVTKHCPGKQVVLEQISRNTVQMVIQ